VLTAAGLRRDVSAARKFDMAGPHAAHPTARDLRRYPIPAIG
jgi:hypothetical protein